MPIPSKPVKIIYSDGHAVHVPSIARASTMMNKSTQTIAKICNGKCTIDTMRLEGWTACWEDANERPPVKERRRQARRVVLIAKDGSREVFHDAFRASLAAGCSDTTVRKICSNREYRKMWRAARGYSFEFE